MANSHFYCKSSFGRSPGISPLQVQTSIGQETSNGQEWQFHISTVKAHIGRSPARYTPQVQTSSGQEWQFHISTVRAHIGRLTGRSKPQVRHLVVKRHLMVKNGNFTFLLLKLILADHLPDIPPKYRHLVIKNANFTFYCKGSYWQITCEIYPPSRGIHWSRMTL